MAAFGNFIAASKKGAYARWSTRMTASSLLGVDRDDLRREDRRGERQREHDRAADGERVGPRHRGEDDAGHPGHREERKECDPDDDGREGHRRRDLARALLDALDHRAFAVGAEVPEDVLDHDDGRVDDDAEVDGPERDEVRRGPRAHEPAEGDEERQRDVERGDQRGAPVPEEEEEHHRHEGHAHEQVLHDRMRRQVNEAPAVVVRDDVDARRQDVVLPDVVDAIVDSC